MTNLSEAERAVAKALIERVEQMDEETRTLLARMQLASMAAIVDGMSVALLVETEGRISVHAYKMDVADLYSMASELAESLMEDAQTESTDVMMAPSSDTLQ